MHLAISPFLQPFGCYRDFKKSFTFDINNTFVLFKGEIVGKERLKKGMLISIGEYDAILETYPAQLKNVRSITIIQDELK